MKKKSIRTLNEIAQQNLIPQTDFLELKKVVDTFSLTISDQMLQLIDKNNPNDPIAQQFIPSKEELNISQTELQDPIADAAHTPVKGIVHRHADRCLFKLAYACAVYCRFCFRKEKIGNAAETISPQELKNAYNYIRSHSEIWEVILTGGDPLMLKPAFLKKILINLATIQHIEVLRIHTRIPIVDSLKINTEMLDALKCGKPVYIIIHANHPKEFSNEAIQAIAQLVDAGIPLLSQTVLLKNINDNIDVLGQLMRCFIKNRIKPYYLHHADLVKGTSHFRTSIKKGQTLLKELRARFSGICQPTYVLDLPGGFGKVPIHSNYILSTQETEYCIEDHNGDAHAYSDIYKN